MIHNPVIKGFNPDPSILRVGEDFYLATSTIQWFPGVQILHSRDLANWRLIDQGRILGVVQSNEGIYLEMETAWIAINDWKGIHLRARNDHGELQFFASEDARAWLAVGPILDMSKLSDDCGTGAFRFTGAFCGICAQDLGDTRVPADFDYFAMGELPTVPASE